MNASSSLTAELLDLHDDCLRHIFQYLTSYDFCAINDTCYRLRELAKCWQEKESAKSNNVFMINDATPEYKKRMTTFIKFSEFYSKLIIDVNHVWKARWIYDVIRKVNPKLDSLTISESDFQLCLQLRETLGHLKEIELKYIKSYGYYDVGSHEDMIVEILKLCTNVEKISFGARWYADPRVDYVGKFLLQKYEHLRSIRIAAVRSLKLDSLKMFLQLNPNVQDVTLCECCVESSDLSYFKQTTDADPFLDLNCNAVRNRIYKLFPLENLTYFSFDAENESRIGNLFTSVVDVASLIDLSISNLYLDFNEKFCESLPNINNWKTLRISIRYIEYRHLSSFRDCLLKKLSNVEVLRWVQIEGKAFTAETITELIRNCIKLKKLYLPLRYRQYHAEFTTYAYEQLVKVQSRKGVEWPLTIFLHDDAFDFAMSDTDMPDAIRKHRNIIALARHPSVE